MAPSYAGEARSKAHYEVQDLATIKAMGQLVELLVAQDSFLFLWVPNPILPMGFDVLAAWGFEYKTIGFVWIKTNRGDGRPFFGTGYYTKSNSEPCLLGIRGKMRPVCNRVSSVLIHPRMEHSKKPPVVRDRIVQLYGATSRIELFAREAAHGWDAHGNEIENAVHIETLTCQT